MATPTLEPTDDVDRGERVRVDHSTPDHRALRAVRSFAAGEVILTPAGQVVDHRSRYTVQVGAGAHLAPPTDQTGAVDDRLWPYLNHSPRPNTRMIDGRLVALRDIATDDELTFDYNANEWDLASPFRCAESGERVAGYRHLSPEERRARGPVAPWLEALAADRNPEGAV